MVEILRREQENTMTQWDNYAKVEDKNIRWNPRAKCED